MVTNSLSKLQLDYCMIFITTALIFWREIKKKIDFLLLKLQVRNLQTNYIHKDDIKKTEWEYTYRGFEL